MLVSLFGTRYLIVFFRQRGQGQPILGKEDHGPVHHMPKQGTPTMGGIAIVVAAFIGWLVAHLRRGLAFSDQTMIVWVGVLFMALTCNGQSLRMEKTKSVVSCHIKAGSTTVILRPIRV